MTPWFRLVTAGSVVRRAAKFALVVGAVLIGINHGDAIAAGDVSVGRALRMALTVCVPYCVSTLSSVAAIREQERRAGEQAPPDHRRGSGNAARNTAP